MLELYVIFALTTSITSCAFLFWPTLKSVLSDKINNEFSQHPVLSVVAYTCIATIFAPVLFLVLIYPPATSSYIEGLSKVLREEKS